MPASNYDSAIAVADRRVVGGTLVRLESAPRYDCDRMARPIPLTTYLERKARAGLRLVRRGNGLRPTIRSRFIPRAAGKGLADNSFVLLTRTTIFLCRNIAFGCRSSST